MAGRNTLPHNLTKDILIEKTGRELGPDIQLKIEKDSIPVARRPALAAAFGANSSLGQGTGNPEGFISSNSPITEVLNIVGYLCNITRNNDSTIDKENSIDITHAVHGTDGNYVGGAGAATIGGSLYLDSNGAAGQQLFDLNTLEAQAPTHTDNLPVGIVKRSFDAAGATLQGYVYTGDIQNEVDVKNLMSDCIKQMINILEQTRTIFGPKGWANLYRKMNGGGGGGANKNHIKRTHRQHRRRYSSKQY
jgi:hypothetical protein